MSSMQYSLSRALFDTQLELNRLTSRELYVVGHIRNLQMQLLNSNLSSERRRQLNIELEDYQEELDLNHTKQVCIVILESFCSSF